METRLLFAAERLEAKTKQAETLLERRRQGDSETRQLQELVRKQSEMLNLQATVIARLEADLRAQH